LPILSIKPKFPRQPSGLTREDSLKKLTLTSYAVHRANAFAWPINVQAVIFGLIGDSIRDEFKQMPIAFTLP